MFVAGVAPRTLGDVNSVPSFLPRQTCLRCLSMSFRCVLVDGSMTVYMRGVGRRGDDTEDSVDEDRDPSISG